MESQDKPTIYIDFITNCRKTARYLIHAFIDKKCVDETTYAVMEMKPNPKVYNSFVMHNALPSDLFDRWAIFSINDIKYMLLVPIDQQSPKYFYSDKFHERLVAALQHYYETRIELNAAKNLWIYKHNPIAREDSEMMFEKFMAMRKEH